MVEKNKVTNKQTEERRLINISITKKKYDWIKKNKYSPTAIFKEACKDLGYDWE